MKTGSETTVHAGVILTLQQEVARLSTLVTLLHDAGLIPTDLLLLSQLRTERAAVEREIRLWLGDGASGTQVQCQVPRHLTEDLARLDRQIRTLEAHL